MPPRSVLFLFLKEESFQTFTFLRFSNLSIRFFLTDSDFSLSSVSLLCQRPTNPPGDVNDVFIFSMDAIPLRGCLPGIYFQAPLTFTQFSPIPQKPNNSITYPLWITVFQVSRSRLTNGTSPDVWVHL
jgi:hypothetical protein